MKSAIFALGMLVSVALPAAEPPAGAPGEPSVLVTVDRQPVTNLHFAIFAAQKRNAGELDTSDQLALLNELVNTFMVAESDDGRALAELPDVKAAIEIERARIVAQALIQDKLQHGEVADADIQAAYRKDYVDAPGMEYKARHILLEDEAAARDVISELDQGADFAELAKARSTGPSGKLGGDLGWFSDGQMVAPFFDATVTLENGSYSTEPVKTRFGWHVILREDSRDIPVPALAEVRDEIESGLRRENLKNYIAAIRAKSDIQVHDADAEVVD